MATRRNIFQHIVAALLALVGYSIPLLAQSQTADLLQSLKSATPEEANRIDRQITAAWSRSGSAAMDLLLRRGREAMEEEDTSVAIEHFTALTDHAPDFAEGWHELGRAYFHAELFGPSIDALERTLALNPDHYRAIFGLGVMFGLFGDYVRAERALLEVLERHPNHEDAQQALENLKRLGVGRTL